MQRPVIVVPGYYGSKLADGVTGEVVWLTAQGLLQPRTTARALRYDPNDPDRLVSAGILEEVPLILPFWDVKVYEGLLDFLLQDQKLPPGWVLPFHYDWRRSMEHAADTLAAQILRLLTETGSDRVNLVAHSFGGLVARGCFQKHGLADKIDWFVTLGTPHKGMHDTFRTMTEGRQIFTFSRAETRDAARDFPSAYELLPNDPADGLFESGGAATVAFDDPSWCVDQRMTNLLAAAGTGVRNLLPLDLPVRSCLVYGTRLDTTTLAQSDGAGHVEFSNTPERDGDGTVPRVSALGQGLQSNHEILRFQVPLGVHSQLPNDQFVQQKILTPILLGRPFPATTICVRFQQQPFFVPRSKNLLVVAVSDAKGDPVPNASVQLSMPGTSIRDRPVPFAPQRGDHVLEVTMPGSSVAHRQWRIEIRIPHRPMIVENGLLVGAA